ncbi:LysM peptidoglycan-binding domain-containing protein [Isoptericola sp. b490]|uniref:LysM peptidoglycan-binding domain-containing protein n=1 Tax=Actinotalea lenta TaxID=3064654 RepID=UPI00271332FF|nr:LysM peptidoglycan-binding domain-containing protein [Isoptericola sp. b490]MDO8119700.1 LysM peptidoglycan-binding domain-containing protein [Isoptericola sp. b490]
MTTTHHVQSRRTVRQSLLGLGAAIALAALVVGVPLALSVIAPIGLPQSWPGWSELGHLVMRPDDGRLALAVIRLIAWGAWAAFTWAVALEAAAAARNTTARRVRLLGGLQRLAATLVGAVLLGLVGPSLTTSASAATGVAAVQVEPSATVPMANPDLRSAGPRQRQAENLRVGLRQAHSDDPVVVVKDGDSLWFIAERHLGDGARYPEIVALNLGRAQPDGRALTDAHWIEPGWQLVLPADAVDVPPVGAVPEAVPAAGETTVVVEPGDSLWEIAEEHLGDGDRYPEIVELNEGVTQADGDALTEPSLIRPGWVLALPGEPYGAGASTATEPDAGAREPDALTIEPDAGPGGADRGGGEPGVATPEPDDAAATRDAAAQESASPASKSDADGASANAAPRVVPPGRGSPFMPDAASATPHAQPRPTHDSAPVESASESAPAGQVPLGLYVGLTALAAAGVVGELARRRRLQHRVRRTGERITRPVPGSPAAAAERELHAAPTPLSLRQLRTVFDHLAAACFTSGRDLPRIGAVEVAPDRVALHLVVDDPAAVEPFSSSSSPRIWSAATATLAALGPIDTAGAPEPYPALVSLGHTDRSTILVNLEAAGALRVVGDPEGAAAVVRAIVAELATSELTGRIGLTASDEFEGLARTCNPVRLQANDGAPERQLAADLDSTTQVLASYGIEDTLQARSDHEAPDTWRPVVYIHDDPPVCSPWRGPVVITTATEGDGWRLSVGSGRGRLDPLGLELTPSRLTAEGLERITELLAAASPPASEHPAAIPAPADAEASAALAALAAPPGPPAPRDRAESPALRMNVLGPLRFENVPDGGSVSGLQAELLVYLTLNRDCTGREIDDALWPGKRTDGEPRWGLAYRARRIVGKSNLPATRRGEELRLAEGVTCDWDDFKRLANSGLAAGREGVPDLKSALALVRGRPLAGVPSSAFGWADPVVDEMISAIVDVAHALSRELIEGGDARGALSAATTGLAVDACSERLRDDAVAAAMAQGDINEARRIQERYDALLEELDDEFV